MGPGAMRGEVWTLIVIVGFCTWAFRYFPTRLDLTALPKTGALARFLASTGPAAIATLFVASVLPLMARGTPLPLMAGVAAVLAVYAAKKSVVGATLAGSAAYGAAYGLMGM